MIEVSLPRDIITTTVTANLDRTRTSNNAAMQNISSVLLAAVDKDGKKVGLDGFVISRDTIRRRRMVHREALCQKAVSEFQENMPEYLLVHYDGSRVNSQFLGQLEARDGGYHCLQYPCLRRREDYW